MIVYVGIIVFVLYIIVKCFTPFEKHQNKEVKPENYIINPKYINSDIPIEAALKDFKLIGIGQR